MSAAQRIPGKMQQWAWAVTSEELRGEEAVENPGTEVRAVSKTSSPPGAKWGRQRITGRHLKHSLTVQQQTVLTNGVKQKQMKNHPTRYHDVIS